MDRQPERNIEASSKHVDTWLGKPEPTWNHIWHVKSEEGFSEKRGGSRKRENVGGLLGGAGVLVTQGILFTSVFTCKPCL